MKHKLWLLQIPVVIFFACAFYVDEMGAQGNLQNAFLRDKLYPGLRRVSVLVTDIKFNLRGERKPKNKIYVAAIDSESIANPNLGRWPWHRDIQALVVDTILGYGAKVVGLDIVNSEADPRVSDGLKQALQQKALTGLAEQAETDPVFTAMLSRNHDKVVLGWTTDMQCQPAYEEKQYCEVAHPDALAQIPPWYPKFAFTEFKHNNSFDPQKTTFQSIVTMIPNITEFSQVATHAGLFNTLPDPDGLIRRITLFYMMGGLPYPLLPVEMARVGLNDDLRLELSSDGKVKRLGFVKSNRDISVTPQGILEINFAGKSRTIPHFSILDLLSSDPYFAGDSVSGQFVKVSKAEALKDAYVLVGPTAVGVNDMRAQPFDNNIGGVEIHANILDNLLSGDSMVSASMTGGTSWVLGLMTVGALAWAFGSSLLNAIPALFAFAISFLSFGAVDLKVLFARNINWNTSFFYLEWLSIFVFTMAAKYVVEERKKKFIRGAFTKYVSPAVVDEILKDPTKLTVGGQKRELTICFSDIRGFTTFSEKMDAKQLSSLLNDYLGIMTNIVFKNQGTLDKYIGDAIMAFWGAPLDQPKHASNAAKTAQAMMRALNENRQRFNDIYGIWVDIGIGLNSGVVSVGNMGSENNFAYTVIGDHVNLASRLEGLTKAYGASILTTRFTFDSIQASGEPFPDHRVLDFVKVKGKKKAVELIQIFENPPSAEGVKLFEEGRFLYSSQKWDAAIDKFGQANKLLAASPEKPDGPCNMFVERCQEFMNNPPGADWDGSWEMHSK